MPTARMPRLKHRMLVAATFALLAAVWPASAQDSAAPAFGPGAEMRWYKGNLHTHTLWSDGNDYPEMVADWYRRAGYHFLALSDHNILSEGGKWIDVAYAAKQGEIGGLARYRQRFGDEWVELREQDGKQQVRLKPLSEFRSLLEEPGRFLMIPGEEITDMFRNTPVHMNATNLRDLINPQGGNSVRETIENNLNAVLRQSERLGRPILPHLNHPNFYYGVTAEDLAAVVQERFFEVFNGHPLVNQQGDETHPNVDRLWDIANTIRIGVLDSAPLNGLAVDDTHNYFGNRDASPGRGWIMVRARHLTAESILAALERGDFYATTGVTLRDVRYASESRVVEIEIVPQPDTTYKTQFIGTLADYDSASQPILGDDGEPLPVTRRYSDDVGRVLATAEGTSARYELTGRELYVRAIVTSNRRPENPSFENQMQQAWTQPVGWEGIIASAEDKSEAAAGR